MAKRSKYNVAPKSQRTLKGTTYMSKLEMLYRKHLDLLSKATLLKDRVVKIEEQVPYVFIINGVKICTYLLDFRVTYGDGRTEHVDVKGVRTATYALKAKLFFATQGFKIKEIKKGDF
jgi:hypothetical protein